MVPWENDKRGVVRLKLLKPLFGSGCEAFDGVGLRGVDE